MREHDFVVSVSVAGVDMCLFFAGARTSTATTPGMLATTTKSTSRATTTSATTKSPSSETFPVVFYFQLQSLLVKAQWSLMNSNVPSSYCRLIKVSCYSL